MAAPFCATVPAGNGSGAGTPDGGFDAEVHQSGAVAYRVSYQYPSPLCQSSTARSRKSFRTSPCGSAPTQRKGRSGQSAPLFHAARYAVTSLIVIQPSTAEVSAG